MNRGRFVVSVTARQLEVLQQLASLPITPSLLTDSQRRALPALRLELEQARFDKLPRAVDLIDALALELDTTIEAAGGDEVHHHPILVKAQRLATRARAFVRSLNRSTHPKEGTP